MHRVELKGPYGTCLISLGSAVPNAPCGVESSGKQIPKYGYILFLMHRVELKELQQCQKTLIGGYRVPNAPCGVERTRRHRVPVRVCPSS